MATPRCAGMSGARRRRAFSSWRSQPTRLPRPAWYQATATCTRPWRKSRSAASAGRQASSSSSWAAKNSPARIKARPRSNGSSRCRESSERDLHLTAFDLDLERLQPDRVVELVLARAHVVLPAVPGAAQGLSLELTFRKRSAQMQARVLRCEYFAVYVGDRSCLVGDLHGRDRPRRDVLDTCGVA